MYEGLEGPVKCEVCPHHCTIPEGKRGKCRARGTIYGRNVPLNYGIISSIALDPIEKKPLRRFYPGSMILSVGSYGCNLNEKLNPPAKLGRLEEDVSGMRK